MNIFLGEKESDLQTNRERDDFFLEKYKEIYLEFYFKNE